MPNRVIAEPYSWPIPNGSGIEQFSIAQADDFLAGLIKDIDPANIPMNALQTISNAIYTRSLLLRRNGLVAYSLTKPNAQKIMSLYVFTNEAQGVNFLRFTPSTIYKATSVGWEEFTPVSEVLNGEVTDYFSFTTIDDRGFFSNWGSNSIMELLTASSEYEPLGNAPKYKFITGVNNRIVGAYLNDTTNIPYQIGWSGNLNFEEWDPLVDISAGFVSLVDSPSDQSDDITGLFQLASVLCITRQRSIWLATFQPSATDPFNFFVSSPKVGCDTPRTIQAAVDGLIFYNFQSSTVYYYLPSSGLEEISGPIKRYLKSLITSPNNLFATFNQDTNSYTLFVENSNNSMVVGFTYNFSLKTWSTETYSNISTCIDLDYASSSLTIDELVGIIDDLEGTIDELGGLVANSNRFFGYQTGELSTQPFFFGFRDQESNIVLDDEGEEFETVLDSKTLTLPINNQYINIIELTVTPYSTGSVKLWYSKDEGENWTLAKTKTFVSGNLWKSQLVKMFRMVTCRRIIWRATTTDCMCAVNRFDVQALPSGPSRK